MADVEVTWNPQVSTEAVRQAALRGVIKGANIVRDEILRLIQQTPHTGLIYRRRGVTHQASAPGEPPASDTGNLVQNVTIEIDAHNLKATITSNAEYADALEFGTTKMEPRPYMRVGLENKTDEVRAAIEDEIRLELEG